MTDLWLLILATITMTAALTSLITFAAQSHTNQRRIDDASRCPNQDQGEEMKIPLNSIAAILMRITALEGRLTVLELRMGVYDRHDGDDQYDDTPEEER